MKKKMEIKLKDVKAIKYNNKSVYCSHCGKNLKDVFFRPCLHLELCL